jgi:hypothetical protein
MLAKNTFLTSLLVVGLSAVPMLATAGSLAINNQTGFYVTTKVNNTICSSRLPLAPIITSPHSSINIEEWKIKAACSIGGSPSNCFAQVYMNNDCLGSPVATARFDLSKGILSLEANTANPDAAKFNFSYNNTPKTYYASISEK